MERLFDIFERAGRELFLVGGAVRDFVRGTPLEALPDYDFATDAPPDETQALLARAGFNTFDVGKRFGTIGTVLRGAPPHFPKEVQVTTYRAEQYRPGSRHPDVAFGTRLEEDLRRRDFRINAMAMRRDRSIVDPFGGRADLEQGLLRAVGDPLVALEDDPLRMLRIARFVSLLGFRADDALRAAATRHAPAILGISRERWLQEMNKLLRGPHVRAALELLRETRLLGLILPEVAALHDFHASSAFPHKDIWAHTLMVVEQSAATLVQRWTALLHDAGKVWTRRVQDGSVSFIGHEAHGAMLFEGVAARFRLDGPTADAVHFVIANHDAPSAYRGDWSDAAVRRLVRRAGPHLDALLEFARADLTTALAEKRAAALERLAELERRVHELARQGVLHVELPRGLGHAVMARLGLAPGPDVGRRIEAVREAALDGRLPSRPTVEEALTFLATNS